MGDGCAVGSLCSPRPSGSASRSSGLDTVSAAAGRTQEATQGRRFQPKRDVYRASGGPDDRRAPEPDR